MYSRRQGRLAACLAAGVATALSLPPWGWWPLAVAGLAVLTWATDGVESWRARLGSGAGFGVGMFVPGLWWMNEFHAVGAIVVVAFEALAVAAAVAVAPGRGRLRVVALPAALVLVEAARGAFPFGGLPMAGIPLGQVSGPLGGVARIGGQLLVLGMAAVAGAAVAEAVRRRFVVATAAAAGVVLVTLASVVAPDGGGAVRTIDTAVVQGGGRRGFRAVETDPAGVFDAHLAATERVHPSVDLVLWPEDVVDVEDAVARVPEGAELAAVADGLDTTLVAGVVEDVGGTRFNNAAVAWGPDGALLDRYDKVHRVPFGEYVPGRKLIERFADLSVIPRDAIPGRAPNRLDTPAGPLGVVISFEVFFPDRARAAARAGGQVLLVPTNAASFTTSQVPTTEVAAAQLRAVETGRDLLQAAPTGYGAVIDHRGRVQARTTLGRRQVLHRTVALRDGTTVYTRIGDLPVLVLALAGLALARLRKVDRAVNDGQP
jgi:apolipoprotein N-acyltransferase